MRKEAHFYLSSANETQSNIKVSSLKRADLLLVLERDDLFVRKHDALLNKTGLFNVTAVKGTNQAFEYLKGNRCDLVFLDFPCDQSKEIVFSFVERVRALNNRCAIALLSATTLPHDIYRAAKLGVSDFLIKSRGLDLSAEALQILNRTDSFSTNHWSADPVRRTGLFRSAGLTKKEIDIISEFSKDFPRYGALAERLGKSSTHINKTFSRIYEKLSATMSIDNPAQLTHLITVCSLFK